MCILYISKMNLTEKVLTYMYIKSIVYFKLLLYETFFDFGPN
jgi:hypothetical protein